MTAHFFSEGHVMNAIELNAASALAYTRAPIRCMGVKLLKSVLYLSLFYSLFYKS